MGSGERLKYLLDTHILIWWVQGALELLTAPEQRILEHELGQHELLVCDISLWEVALMVERQRIRLDLPVREWLERATAPPLVRRCPLSPTVVAETLTLPEGFHRDPADRLIVCTARVHQATLLTRDERIRISGAVNTLD